MTTLLAFLSSLLPSFIQKREKEREPVEFDGFNAPNPSAEDLRRLYDGGC
jgi:hypothetical protein